MADEFEDKDAEICRPKTDRGTYWWDAWTRAVAEVYKLRDKITQFKDEIKQLKEEIAPLRRAYDRNAEELKDVKYELAPDVVYKERQIALNDAAALRRAYKRMGEEQRRSDETMVKFLDRKQATIERLRGGTTHLYTRINDQNDELDALRRENTKLRDRAGPYYVTAEQYVIQSRAAADKLDIIKAAMKNLEPTLADRAVENFKTARILGADLGHWQGFKFNDETPTISLKPGTINYRTTMMDLPIKTKPGVVAWFNPPKYIDPAPGSYAWGKDVPADTQFAIGGRTTILKGGGMGYFGTETTTVKITDDTLSRALGSLTADLDQNRGQSVGSGSFGGQSMGGGQGPAISAAVTILPGGRIRLKLKVGSAIHEVRTFLTAGGGK